MSLKQGDWVDDVKGEDRRRPLSTIQHAVGFDGQLRGRKKMRNAAWVSIIVTLALTHAGTSATAGLFGGYSCCPPASCAPSGDLCAAKTCCPVPTCCPAPMACPAPACPAYKTVYETVWEKQCNTCCKTVYDHVCEQVPYCHTRLVFETCYKDCCFTVCKPCFQTYYKDVCYTKCRPCHQTCYKDVCYTVCKPCYTTCYRDVTCTTYKTEQQTCSKDVCYTVCKPITEKKIVPVKCGEWQTVTETVPGAVMDQCQCDPGHWEYDPCTCCCMYHAGCCHVVKVQCPPTTCCRRVWVEKTVQPGSMLHAVRDRSEALPGSLHGLPSDSLHDDPQRGLHGLQLHSGSLPQNGSPTLSARGRSEVCHKQVPCVTLLVDEGSLPQANSLLHVPQGV